MAGGLLCSSQLLLTALDEGAALAMSSQSSTVHAPPRLLEHPPKILKPAALGLALLRFAYLVSA